MYSLSSTGCNTFQTFIKIIQVLLILIIMVLQSIYEQYGNTTIFISPSIIIVVYACFFLFQKKFVYYQQIASLICGTIVLITLRILNKEGQSYMYTASIIFSLFNDNTMLLHREAFIFISLQAFIAQFNIIYDNKYMTITALIIISFLIQIGLIIVLELQAKGKKQTTFLSIQPDSPRQDETSQIIERFSWLISFNAFLFDRDIELLYCFHNQSSNIQSKNNSTLEFLSQQYVCNESLMKLDQLIQHLVQEFDQSSNRYFQFISQDHKSIINIIAVNKNKQLFYVVYYQQIPKYYDILASLLDVTSSISHELSSHLNCIITLSQLYYDNPDLLTKKSKENFIEPILANSQQLELIINNLKDYNNIQIQNFQSYIQKFDIVFEIFEICDYFKMIIQEKQLQINFKFSLENHFVESDRQRFRQIFYQLMQNAIKFTFKNNIEVFVCNEQSLIKIQVIDSGQGMDESEQSQLTQIFKNEKLARVSRKSVGCSLGLHISNLLAKKIGDNRPIHFESFIQQGSNFTFWIKNFEQLRAYKNHSTLKKISIEQYQDSQLENLIQAQSIVNDYYSNSRLSVQQKKIVTSKQKKSYEENISLNYSDDNVMSANAPPVLQTKRLSQNSYNLRINQKADDCCVKILIVDDEFFNIFALQTFIKQQNQKSEYAFDGQEAINKIQQKIENPCKLCKQNSYKLVFLDINMPIKDGIQTVREIKQMVSSGNLKNICCAANSAFSDIETKQRAYEAGMDFYLTKPLNLPILKQLITNIFIGQVI